MKHNYFRFLSLYAFMVFAALTFFLPASAHAELRLDLTRGTVKPLPLAVTTFYGSSQNEKELGANLSSIVSSNLESSGLFKTINPRAFVQKEDSIQKDGVRFGEWRANGTQALVTGLVTKSDDGKTRVEFRLWDVFGEKQLLGTAYTTTPSNWRRPTTRPCG